jgi:hypothetical protein
MESSTIPYDDGIRQANAQEACQEIEIAFRAFNQSLGVIAWHSVQASVFDVTDQAC